MRRATKALCATPHTAGSHIPVCGLTHTWGIRDSKHGDRIMCYNMDRQEAERVASAVPGFVAVRIATSKYSPERRRKEIGHVITY